MGAIGPGGAAAPKLNIDPDAWASKSQGEIHAEVVRRKQRIAEMRGTLRPGNANNIATAFDIQRTQEDVRVLSAMLLGPVEVDCP